MIARYEPVIGLEVHVQLATATKIFCGCPTSFGAPPNTNVCPVCLGLPGALPVLSREAVELAIKGALALNCEVRAHSRFARKNYFYPDLPKGYQISQYDEPLAEHGFVDIVVDGASKRIGVTRVHMEDDAGKSVHDGFKDSDRYSYVDLNRSGTPLIEIVSEPDMRSADEAHAYLTELKQVMQFIEVSTCDMEKGHLRCDANVSVRLKGTEAFGTQAEVKNLNSFRFLKQAHRFRSGAAGGADRERRPGGAGDAAVQSGPGRDLQHAQQGRRARLPLFSRARPGAAAHRREVAGRGARLHAGVARAEAGALPRRVRALRIRCRGADRDARHQRIFRDGGERFRQSQDGGELGDGRPDGDAECRGQGDCGIAGERAESGAAGEADRERGALRQAGEADFPEDVFYRRGAAAVIVEREGLKQISDTGALEKIIADVIAANPKQVEQYRGGKTTVINFLVGQAMKATRGQANVAAVTELFKQKLG